MENTGLLDRALETTRDPLDWLNGQLSIWSTTNPLGSFHPDVKNALKKVIDTLNQGMADGLDDLNSALVEHLDAELVQALVSLTSHQVVTAVGCMGFYTTSTEEQNVGDVLRAKVHSVLNVDADSLEDPPTANARRWVCAQEEDILQDIMGMAQGGHVLKVVYAAARASGLTQKSELAVVASLFTREGGFYLLEDGTRVLNCVGSNTMSWSEAKKKILSPTAVMGLLPVFVASLAASLAGLEGEGRAEQDFLAATNRWLGADVPAEEELDVAVQKRLHAAEEEELGKKKKKGTPSNKQARAA